MEPRAILEAVARCTGLPLRSPSPKMQVTALALAGRWGNALSQSDAREVYNGTRLMTRLIVSADCLCDDVSPKAVEVARAVDGELGAISSR